MSFHHDLHKGAGLWERQDLPTESVYRLLVHLAGPGEPRLYIQYDRGHPVQASVSNTTHEHGRSVNTVNYQAALRYREPWVSVDLETTRKCGKSIMAYKINKRGLEVVAQYATRKRFDKEAPELARRILEEERRLANARNDN